jgi:hypothetical protein
MLRSPIAYNRSLINITKPAWNKFRNMLKNHDADAIHIGTKVVHGCLRIDRVPSPRFMTHAFFEPTLSLIQTNDWNKIYAEDKHREHIMLLDDDTRAILSWKTSNLLHGVNIHFSPPDYFNDDFDGRFMFSSSNRNHFLCSCGTLVGLEPNNNNNNNK